MLVRLIMLQLRAQPISPPEGSWAFSSLLIGALGPRVSPRRILPVLFPNRAKSGWPRLAGCSCWSREHGGNAKCELLLVQAVFTAQSFALRCFFDRGNPLLLRLISSRTP